MVQLWSQLACLHVKDWMESSPVLLCTNAQHKVSALGWTQSTVLLFSHGTDLFPALSWQMWFDMFYIPPWAFICMSNSTKYICFKLAQAPKYTLAMAQQPGYHSDSSAKPFLLWKPHCALDLFPCKKLDMDALKWANICRDVTDPTTLEAVRAAAWMALSDLPRNWGEGCVWPTHISLMPEIALYHPFPFLLLWQEMTPKTSDKHTFWKKEAQVLRVGGKQLLPWSSGTLIFILGPDFDN